MKFTKVELEKWKKQLAQRSRTCAFDEMIVKFQKQISAGSYVKLSKSLKDVNLLSTEVESVSNSCPLVKKRAEYSEKTKMAFGRRSKSVKKEKMSPIRSVKNKMRNKIQKYERILTMSGINDNIDSLISEHSKTDEGYKTSNSSESISLDRSQETSTSSFLRNKETNEENIICSTPKPTLKKAGPPSRNLRKITKKSYREEDSDNDSDIIMIKLPKNKNCKTVIDMTTPDKVADLMFVPELAKQQERFQGVNLPSPIKIAEDVTEYKTTTTTTTTMAPFQMDTGSFFAILNPISQHNNQITCLITPQNFGLHPPNVQPKKRRGRKPKQEQPILTCGDASNIQPFHDMIKNTLKNSDKGKNRQKRQNYRKSNARSKSTDLTQIVPIRVTSLNGYDCTHFIDMKNNLTLNISDNSKTLALDSKRNEYIKAHESKNSENVLKQLKECKKSITKTIESPQCEQSVTGTHINSEEASFMACLDMPLLDDDIEPENAYGFQSSEQKTLPDKSLTNIDKELLELFYSGEVGQAYSAEPDENLVELKGQQIETQSGQDKIICEAPIGSIISMDKFGGNFEFLDNITISNFLGKEIEDPIPVSSSSPRPNNLSSSQVNNAPKSPPQIIYCLGDELIVENLSYPLENYTIQNSNEHSSYCSQSDKILYVDNRYGKTSDQGENFALCKYFNVCKDHSYSVGGIQCKSCMSEQEYLIDSTTESSILPQKGLNDTLQSELTQSPFVGFAVEVVCEESELQSKQLNKDLEAFDTPPRSIIEESSSSYFPEIIENNCAAFSPHSYSVSHDEIEIDNMQNDSINTFENRNHASISKENPSDEQLLQAMDINDTDLLLPPMELQSKLDNEILDFDSESLLSVDNFNDSSSSVSNKNTPLSDNVVTCDITTKHNKETTEQEKNISGSESEHLKSALEIKNDEMDISRNYENFNNSTIDIQIHEKHSEIGVSKPPRRQNLSTGTIPTNSFKLNNNKDLKAIIHSQDISSTTHKNLNSNKKKPDVAVFRSDLDEMNGNSLNNDVLTTPNKKNQFFYTDDMEKFFNITCYPFLKQQCTFGNQCAMSHKLRDIDSVRIALQDLSVDDINTLYKFVYKYKKLYIYYFNEFCYYYGENKNVSCLRRMCIDCQRYLKFPTEKLLTIYECLVNSGLSKANACKTIIQNFRHQTSAFSNQIFFIIINSDLRLFAGDVERFLSDQNVVLNGSTLTTMAEHLLNNPNDQNLRLFFKSTFKLKVPDVRGHPALQMVLNKYNLLSKATHHL